MDIMRDPKAAEAIKPLTEMMARAFGGGEESSAAQEAITDDMMKAMIGYMPLRGLVSFAGGQVPDGFLDELLKQLNA